MKAFSTRRWPRVVCLLGLAAIALTVGCKYEVLSSSRWNPSEDVHYFPPGPEFKLATEKAVMKEAEAEAAAEAAP